MATPRSAIYREMIEGFEYSDAEITKALGHKNESQRKITALQKKHVLNDRLKYVLDSCLNGMFVQVSYLQIRKYLDASCNLLRRVNKEISLVYQREPERKLDNQTAQDRYDEIIQETHMDLCLSRANFLLNGLNDLVLYPIVMQNSFAIGMLTPDQVTVLCNESDPTMVEALIIEEKQTTDDGATNSMFTFWSPTRHFLFKPDPQRQGSFIKISVNENDENPYKEINLANQSFRPFTFCHSSYRDNCFWDVDTNTSLYEGTLLVGIQNTFKNFMIPQQFKQLAVKMATKGEGAWINDQVSNPLHIFQTNGDMTVLDWQSAIDKLDLVISNKISQVCNDYGISAEQMKLQISAQSGFSRLVAKERIYELRDDQIKYWRIYEKELFESLRDANNLYLLTDFTTGENTKVVSIPDEAVFSVDFAEPKVLIDPKEDLDVKQIKIDMGILSPIDLIMSENPDIVSREEASAKLKSNLQERDMITAAGASFRTPSLAELAGQSGKMNGSQQRSGGMNGKGTKDESGGGVGNSR